MFGLGDLVDIFFGTTNWSQRVQETIEFTSPEGNSFSAKWIGNRRSKDKKLGIYFYPKVRGNVVDDLEINSSQMPITIYFEGKNNDQQANAFYAAANETGVWEVIHPVNGFFGLQLVSISENIQPVTSGNITAMDTVWIEPIDPDTLQTDRELAGIVDSLSADLNLSAIDQFVNNVTQASTSLQNVIETTTQGIANVSDFILSPLTTLSDEIYQTNNALQDGLVDTLNSTVLPLESLAGQVQGLIEFPSLASNDLQTRLDIYTDHTDGMFTVLPGGSNQAVRDTASALERKNNTATTELALNANLVAFAQIAVTSRDLRTRAQALGAAQNLADNFNLIQETLEQTQVALEDEDIDQQYFAQTESYATAVLLTNKAIRYLQLRAFDLKVERRFFLKEARASIEVSISEYNSQGETVDTDFDLFVESNELKGDEVMFLPAGKEVVVYD